MTKVIEEKEHARLSPSASKRWMTCPGSVRMERELAVKDKPSRFAAEGTVAHEVHELCLLNKHKALDYLGKTFEADGMKFKVTEEMAGAVQESLDYIWDIIEVASWKDIRVEVRVEVRCSLKSLGIKGLDGGTSDVILMFYDELDVLLSVEVFDYKHGAGVAVECENNTQAMSYALGTILLPELNGEGIPDGILITISQPRAHHPDGRIRSWRTTKDHLLNWCSYDLVPAALETAKEDSALVPSDDGCRFCRVAGQCPKLYERTQEVAMLDFEEIGDDEAKFPTVESLTSEQKQYIMEHGAAIRSFIVAVENQIKLEMDGGSQNYEANLKLVRKTSRRKFLEDATDQLTSLLYDVLEHSDIYEEKARSMTEIEKRLKKAIGAKDAKEIMDEITTKPDGDIVVAPKSDKRKAVQPTLVSDFDNLND